MSRIGNKPISIPEGVGIDTKEGLVEVKGPKGELEIEVDKRINVKLEDEILSLSRNSEEPVVKGLHGLYRTLIANSIQGVTEGFFKILELQGVGFKVVMKGNDLELSVGYSHTVLFKAVEGISFKVPDQNTIHVEGIDKGLVGQVAANIRSVKPPEPYKGKGIRYQGEYVRRKAGKAALGAGAPGAPTTGGG